MKNWEDNEMTWEELSISQQQEVERQMEVITRGAVEIVPEGK